MHENRETSATPAAQPGRRSAGEGQSHHPALEKLGINKRIGWHTFRHSFSTLLRQLGTDIKGQQDLLRHSSARLTLDTYTQAVTPAKRDAQNAVVELLFVGRLGVVAAPTVKI